LSRLATLSRDAHPRTGSRAADQQGGHDWAERFPLIVTAALKLRPKRFVLDGEVVVLDKDGVSDFDANTSAPAANSRLRRLPRCLSSRFTTRSCG
jgi:hypothetical protein